MPPSTQPAAALVPDALAVLEDSELMGDDLDSLLDCFSTEQETTQVQCGLCCPLRIAAPLAP